MKVYLVSVKGTIYKIFDSVEKAQEYIDQRFGNMYEVEIDVRDVE